MIRSYSESDFDAVWTIFEEVIKGGDTYAFDPNSPKESLKKWWVGEGFHVYVWEEDGEVIGSYYIKANQPDLGNHTANCGYMVSSKARGKGIGQLMCEHSIIEAKSLGFLGMQYNFVVSTNVKAVRLWQRCGFDIIGTTPKGFRHSQLGYVDTYIMYRSLE